MTPAIIACDLHDHVEIICMRRYPIRVRRMDGSQISGTAVNTRTGAGEEYLQLHAAGDLLEVPLQLIEHIEVFDSSAPLTTLWLQPRQ
ncbi:Rho-binding antiterminator [Shewanella sp. CG12_big_fil_rev_8_21_14_0_65_47_15]|uniref:Rho-binding antiterminator n=1 Tax=Shewanella sp. CG12_big_fil_rev_8_21_14_0_65_47_15 TaxID=1975537 RepID=UPI000CB150A1|nr:Rho-binding antiterminator [Shewanella sp. CG12_big_fil_rev_8_21_14_0_65_47_15]PIW61775.1 MAG: transcriptional antiterminator [Shewanella sp. CG12_big_fil_rev_8_21_14_0_65_47_15]